MQGKVILCIQACQFSCFQIKSFNNTLKSKRVLSESLACNGVGSTLSAPVTCPVLGHDKCHQFWRATHLHRKVRFFSTLRISYSLLSKTWCFIRMYFPLYFWKLSIMLFPFNIDDDDVSNVTLLFFKRLIV